MADTKSKLHMVGTTSQLPSTLAVGDICFIRENDNQDRELRVKCETDDFVLNSSPASFTWATWQ